VQVETEGLVFKAHRPLYHSTLGLRVIKKKKKETEQARVALLEQEMERIFIELMTSDRKLKASREGSNGAGDGGEPSNEA